MTEYEALAHKKIIRMEKAIKALRRQLTYAHNAVRSKLFLDDEARKYAAQEMKKVLDDTKDYWRGVRIEDAERAMYGLPPKHPELKTLTPKQVEEVLHSSDRDICP